MTSRLKSSSARPNRGQVLIIVAFSMVTLIVIAALVVDLGLSWMLRRQEQNAADPGAVAAARYINEDGSLDMTMARDAACFYARKNGIFPDGNTDCDPAGQNPHDAVLAVNYPPDAAAGQFAGSPYYVQVVIGSTHPSFFGRIFGQAEASVVTSAVAANVKGYGNSNSLVALDPTTCSSGVVSGGAQVSIVPTIDPSTGLPYVGGYVQINSSCGNPTYVDGTCGVGEGSSGITMNGAGSSLTAPKVFVHGTCGRANNNSFSSPLEEGAVQIGDPLASLQPPRISDFTPGQCGVGGMVTAPTGAGSHGCNFNSGGTTYTLYPGVYYGGWSIGNNVSLGAQCRYLHHGGRRSQPTGGWEHYVGH